jgi:transcriptional regulator with XRE-family HTH domain
MSIVLAWGVPIFDALKRARKAAGISQAELARRSGVDQAYISRLEGGKAKDPGWTTITAIAAVLGISLDELAAADRPDPSLDPS